MEYWKQSSRSSSNSAGRLESILDIGENGASTSESTGSSAGEITELAPDESTGKLAFLGRGAATRSGMEACTVKSGGCKGKETQDGAETEKKNKRIPL